jgi:regulator of RNase E activity RraA
MAVIRRKADFRILSEAELQSWKGVATAVVGDAQNRSQCMSADIKPLKRGLCFYGQARTVQTAVGDNSAVHAAIALLRPGEVLAIDAGGHVDTAIWGEVMTVAAQSRGVAAVVLDGAVRDAAKMREMNFTIFACGVVPRGPHKGFGGTIDGPVSVGGVTVYPGDLLIGDDDGVAVVPLTSIDAVLKEVQRIESRETQMLDAIRAGKSSAEVVGVMVPAVSTD